MAMGGRYLHHLWKNATSKMKFSTGVVGSMYDSSRLRRRSGTGGDGVMRADVIEKLKRNSLRKKLDVESELADWDDPNFPAATFLERVCSKDMDILKGLLKDMRNLNRKNMNKLERRQKKEDLIKQQQQQEEDTDIEDGVFYGSTLHVQDQATADIARHILQAYNQQQNLKLEFARVIDVVQDPYPLHYHLLIEARDLNAASVPIKLQAFYTINPKEFKVNNVLQPVPFMKLLYKDKDEEKKKLSLEERETLLYANIRDCPIIAKRLGLKGGRHQVFCKPHDDCSSMGRPRAPFLKDSANSVSLIKLSLDNHDETLLCLAKFAVAEQSANQGSHLEFLRVVGAWREVRVGDRYIIDHMMLEALENGVGRRFYAAVASESNGKDAQLVEWVPTNSQKITLNEGGKV